MGIIQLRVHIASSLLGMQEDNPLPQFGRQMRNQNVNSLHGFCCTKKILTANNLEKRGWPHDPLCKLCNTTLETPKHLCKDCPFTCAVCVELVNWLNLHQLPTSGSVSSIYRWWKKYRAMVAKNSKSFFDGFVIYFWWNIWKERRRTFW